MQTPCRQSLYSAAEGNMLISRSDCTLSRPTAVMFTLSIQTHSSTKNFILLGSLVVFGYPIFIRREIAQNSIEVDAKTKESTRKTEEKLDGRNKEGHARKKPK